MTMKKWLSLLLTFTMVFSLAACGNGSAGENSSSTVSSQSEGSASTVDGSSTPNTNSSQQDEEGSSDSLGTPSLTKEPSQPETEEGFSSLVVYFSWSGNTESVAKEIQAQTGADIFEIVPTEPYAEDYNALLDLAKNEQANAARPGIAETIENFQQYDVIYLGFPNWWGDMPMILYTFLDEYDLSGKTIAPFVTSGGSGFSGTISTIEGMEPDATMTNGLSLSSSEAADPGSAVTQWLVGIELSA